MGCASSKSKVCRKCKAPYSPVRRSISTHDRRRKSAGGNYTVSLTSSTLGSLNLDPLFQSQLEESSDKADGGSPANQNQEIVRLKTTNDEFTMSVVEAKTWSEMIDKKIPKIVPRTPPGEPEMINAWELMEGLEDISPLRQVRHFRSFSFQMSSTNSSLASMDDQTTPTVKDPASTDLNSDSNSNDTSIISDFDPNVIASFRRVMESTDKISPRVKDRLIFYFTSLRGVRKTYEDCCHVRVLLKGLRIKIDERDVSMHSGFKEELKELLGDQFGGLPQVFIGKRYIGGFDEIRCLNEEGKLEKMIENCELLSEDGDGNGVICEACGDVRFVPCGTCSGSCKIYYEEDYVDEDDEIEHEFGFQRCLDCNENGLIRCPNCCNE